MHARARVTLSLLSLTCSLSLSHELSLTYSRLPTLSLSLTYSLFLSLSLSLSVTLLLSFFLSLSLSLLLSYFLSLSLCYSLTLLLTLSLDIHITSPENEDGGNKSEEKTNSENHVAGCKATENCTCLSSIHIMSEHLPITHREIFGKGIREG